MTGLLVTKDPYASAAEYARGLDAIPTSTAEVLGAAAAQTLHDLPSYEAWRMGRRGVAGDYTPGEADTPWGLDLQPAPTSPTLSAEDATREFGIKGHLKFDGPTPESVARDLFETARERMAREAIIARGQGGVAEEAGKLAVGLALNILDPLNVASAFVPVVGQARVGMALAGAGSALGRAAVRAGVGAVEGVAGAAMLEPLHYAAQRQEQADYGAVDSLLNIAFGGVFGGGLHMGGGAVADAMRPGRWSSPVAAAADAAPLPAREAALRGALAAVAEGDLPPAELGAVLREQDGISAAWAAVKAEKAGPADDPLVAIEPADIDRVLVARGGYKGVGDIEVKGSGWGIVKFIVRHGDESGKAPEFQVGEADLRAFPEIIRNFEPSRPASADGSRGREWRVELPGPDGASRVVVFADNRMPERGPDAHLVSMYVQEPGRPGADAPLSVRRGSDAPPSRSEVGSPLADTAPAVSIPAGGRSASPRGSLSRRGGDSNIQPLFDAAGRRVDVKYEVRELGDLIASTRDDFSANPDYPAHLQPRQRDRMAGQAQIADIVGKFEPGRLMRSNDASTGAPVIGPDKVVESGNGRTMSLRRVYADHPDKARQYQAELVRGGFSVAGFDQPVLVARRLTEMDDATRQAFTVDAQRSATLTLSAAEQAAADARLLDDVMGLHRGGDLELARNRDFVTGFMARLPQAEQGRMATKTGELSVDGKRRINDALLARAYDDVDLLGRMIETSDDGNRALGAALRDAAPRWAALRDAAERGDIAAHVDATEDLLDAVRLVRDAVAAGRPLDHILSQIDAFSRPSAATEMFVAAFVNGKRMASKEAIAERLGRYIDGAMRTSAGPDLLGGKPASREEILQSIVRRNPDGGDVDGRDAVARIDKLLAEVDRPTAGRDARMIGLPDDDALIDGDLARLAVLGHKIDDGAAAEIARLGEIGERDARALDVAAFCLSRGT